MCSRSDRTREPLKRDARSFAAGIECASSPGAMSIPARLARALEFFACVSIVRRLFARFSVPRKDRVTPTPAACRTEW